MNTQSLPIIYYTYLNKQIINNLEHFTQYTFIKIFHIHSTPTTISFISSSTKKSTLHPHLKSTYEPPDPTPAPFRPVDTSRYFPPIAYSANESPRIPRKRKPLNFCQIFVAKGIVTRSAPIRNGKRRFMSPCLVSISGLTDQKPIRGRKGVEGG